MSQQIKFSAITQTKERNKYPVLIGSWYCMPLANSATPIKAKTNKETKNYINYAVITFSFSISLIKLQ